MYNTDLPKREDLPSSARLLRSTIIAFVVAAVLLITIVLPAEYGVDPTRIGRVLGLTQMGEIKAQLAEEAAREDVTQAPATDEDVLSTAPAEANTALPEAEPAAETEAVQIAETDTPQWSDEVSLTLSPGAAAEVKLTMSKGEVVDYEWVVSSGHLNSDLHGDAADGSFVSYRKGRSEKGDVGQLSAEFDGAHGWFWRNRSEVDVEVTLKVRGQYSEVKRVL